MSERKESSRLGSMTPGRRSPRSWKLRVALIACVILLVGIIFTAADLAPDLSHMDLTVLSGPESGRYHALVARIAADAVKRRGTVRNVATTGYAESIQRLIEGDKSGRTLFALVHDGLMYSQPDRLELVARLPKAEMVLILGPGANRVHYLSDLKGMRIGIGPKRSGAALLAKRLLGAKDLAGLELTLSPNPYADQLAKLRQGELDLGVFVMEEDDPLVRKAVREGMQIVSFTNVEAMTRRIPALRVGVIYAGHYDHVRRLPRQNKKVLLVDTLVLSDRTASRSEIAALLTLLTHTFHDLLAHNRDTPNHTGLPVAPGLRRFIANGGPGVLDRYAPWLVDFMPLANIFHFVVVISLLFNAMAVMNRFRLWRLDAAKVRVEDEAYALFGAGMTMNEIARLQPRKGHFTQEERKRLDGLIGMCEALRQRCRRHSLSILVPMGQELIYRYQETLIHDRLTLFRDLRKRMDAAEGVDLNAE